jgi:hypothetical protein
MSKHRPRDKYSGFYGWSFLICATWAFHVGQAAEWLAPSRYLLGRPAQTHQLRHTAEQRTMLRLSRLTAAPTTIHGSLRRRRVRLIGNHAAMPTDLVRNHAR